MVSFRVVQNRLNALDQLVLYYSLEVSYPQKITLNTGRNH